MEFTKILSLQGLLFVLVVIGIIGKKTNVFKKESKDVLTDFLIYIILPCNVIASFMTKFEKGMLIKFLVVLIFAFGIQFFAIGLNFFLYKNQSEERQKILKYSTVISNAGFMGVAVIEGVYGGPGLMYAAICLIPQRILIWSIGLAYFTEAGSKKELIKKIAVHPCIISVYIGMAILIWGIPVPEFLARAIRSTGNCTMVVSMILIGVILGEIKELNNFLTKTVIFYNFIRLIFLPLVVFSVGKFLDMDPLILGVQVLITGMPAASTTAILASKFNGDSVFATKCVLASSILSLFTIPVWCYVLGI